MFVWLKEYLIRRKIDRVGREIRSLIHKQGALTEEQKTAFIEKMNKIKWDIGGTL